MKLFIILILTLSSLIAQEKGYIDMHGGKKSSLVDKNSKLSNINSLSSNPFLKYDKNEKEEEKTPSKKNREKNYKQD